MLSRIGHLQFVAQQLKLMREEGLTKREACFCMFSYSRRRSVNFPCQAFKRTEDIFRERPPTSPVGLPKDLEWAT